MLILFAVMTTLVPLAGYLNFNHRVEKREIRGEAIVEREDARLKEKGIALPGYNYPSPSLPSTPGVAVSAIR